MPEGSGAARTRPFAVGHDTVVNLLAGPLHWDHSEMFGQGNSLSVPTRVNRTQKILRGRSFDEAKDRPGTTAAAVVRPS